MDDLGNNAIIQNWHDGTAFAARQGWEVVNSMNEYTYFDYPQITGLDKPKWMPLLPLEKVYLYDPYPAGLAPEYDHYILGGEACLWTEIIGQNNVYDAIFPRLFAIAECVWSPLERKDYGDFLIRAEREELRLSKLVPNIYWGTGDYDLEED
jgi:hexosaminidase